MKIAQMNVQLIDSMGTDLSVVNAARVSMAKESEWELVQTMDEHNCVRIDPRLSAADEKLIHYLSDHDHWTPFAHCFASFRIKVPIYVHRQIIKHLVGMTWTTAGIPVMNEVSRRYVDEEPEFYFSPVWRSRPEGSIKQGSGGAMPEQELWTQSSMEQCKGQLAWYMRAIACGMAPEQARAQLPHNIMTEWWWSGSLAAWARVGSLRLDPHAQAETTEVVRSIAGYMASLFPVSWKALT